MSKAKLLTALGIGTGTTVIGHNLYKAHQKALEEAKKELDPIETTLDAAEEYVLDPADSLLDNITPGKAAAGLATLAALGYGGNYLYNRSRKKGS